MVLAAYFAGCCAYFTYLPFQDLPNLLYQGIAFGNIIFHGNSMDGYYSITPYIPPNTVSTVIIALLHEVFSPFASAKIYVFLLGCFLYSGIYRYLRYHSSLSDINVCIAAFILTFNMHFLAGYLNFVTGLAYALHAVVTLRRRNWQENFIALSVTLLLAYLCHFFSVFIIGVYVVVFALTSRRLKAIAVLCVSAIPALVLGIHYFFSHTVISDVPSAAGVTFLETIEWKSFVYFAPSVPFHRFKWVSELPAILQWTNTLSIAAMIVLVCYGLLRALRTQTYSLSFWLFLVFSVVAIALPANLGGNLMPGERLSVVAMLSAVILICEQIHVRRLAKFVQAIGIIICIMIAVHIPYNTWLFNKMISGGEIPYDAIHNSHYKREGTNGFIHFHIYQAIERHQPVPLFGTGIILSKEAEPVMTN